MGREEAGKVPEDGYGLSDEWVGLKGQTLGVGAGNVGFAGKELGVMG